MANGSRYHVNSLGGLLTLPRELRGPPDACLLVFSCTSVVLKAPHPLICVYYAEKASGQRIAVALAISYDACRLVSRL